MLFTLKETWVFATNQFATTYDYLSLATNVDYFYNHFGFGHVGNYVPTNL